MWWSGSRAGTSTSEPNVTCTHSTADDRVQEGPTDPAAEVSSVDVTPDEQRRVLSRDSQLLALDTTHRLVRSARRGTALRAVAVHRVHERILDLILGCAACAPAAEHGHEPAGGLESRRAPDEKGGTPRPRTSVRFAHRGREPAPARTRHPRPEDVHGGQCALRKRGATRVVLLAVVWVRFPPLASHG